MFNSLTRSSPERRLCICDLEPLPQVDFDAVDLAFVSRHSPFWFNRLPSALSARVFDFLSHRISNNPKDLLAHLQRVAAHYHAGNPDTLYGALLDLFIVLDTKGYALRKRLLIKCVPLLDSERQWVLKKGLKSGLNAIKIVPPTTTVCLTPPNRGSIYLVERHDEYVVAENFNALDEARDLIDSGFIDEGRLLLEELLLRQPESEEISKELLELYKYTNNRDDFFAAKARYDGLPLALADGWKVLADRFVAMDMSVSNE